MAKKTRATVVDPELKFYQKLILNRWLFGKFGAANFKELSANMKTTSFEEVDSEGVTGFHKQLIALFGDKCMVSNDKLARYDLNIVSHMKKINEKRDEPLVLKYFQYLSLLFVEHYLDEYFNDRQYLLDSLNEYVADFNAQYPNDTIHLYTKSDLNKIAVWNATGSGKTLIMHINYYQYLHYSGGMISDEATYILLTPKEGLSIQHLDDYELSGIPAKIYDKNASRWMRTEGEISVLENTKMGDKDQDTVVSIKRFGNRNVVFVDEGHRGSSSGKDGKWQKYRDELCSEGFSFEYSATFGQAIATSNDKSLTQRYQKCIIFDYSYKYFYGDGYGKDYNIINLPDDSDEVKRMLYLTACLMTYYQQKKFYLCNKSEYTLFNIENPLFVFVGAKVNAVRTEAGRKISDVVDILQFFKGFIDNSALSTVYIERVLSGNTGLLDSNNRDIFRNTFPYLMSSGLSAASMYLDILKTVFNCASVGAILHIENLRGISGEIGLRLGDNAPFGVINVGDDSALLNLCTENGFDTNVVDFSESLFQGIAKTDSTINLLIGSKKFTEGWNCWRVSTMGLMNVGRSEGSEIIQLFGRGVRLKGIAMSLKRSGFYKKDFPDTVVPKNIGILETLNVFGVRADYMKQFKEFLEAEGVPSNKGQSLVLSMPVIRNKDYKKSGLYSLRVKNNANFKTDAAKPSLEICNGILVILDCYAKVQFESSKSRGTGEVTKNQTYLHPKHLAFLNYDAIYNEMQRYKSEKARHNVNITRKAVYELLHDNSWYKLLISEDELVIRSFEDYKRFEKIAVALLTKYFEKFYYAERARWESKVVGYDLVAMADDNENFLNEENDEYTISVNNSDENESMILWLKQVITKVSEAKVDKQIIDLEEIQGDMEVVGNPIHLYNPLLFLAKGNMEINIFPIALNESESSFIKELQKYVFESTEYFKDKEIYLIRNKSKKGIGFFEDKGFFPDFIMWLIANGKQYITFIDPHGMGRETITSEKVALHTRIKTEIENTLTDSSVVLNSFILSPTKYVEMSDKSTSVVEWNANNVLFMEDNEYISKMFNSIES